MIWYSESFELWRIIATYAKCLIKHLHIAFILINNVNPDTNI